MKRLHLFSIVLVTGLLVVTADDAAAQPAALNEAVKLLASDPSGGDKFGLAVGVDGETLIAGAENHDDQGTSSGAAYIFSHGGNGWIESAKLLASDGQGGDRFGFSVAIHGDRAVVGARAATINGVFDVGAAYVFERIDGVWIEQAKLTAIDGEANDHFGESVAVSNDTIAVGAHFDDDFGERAGAVYVFARTGSGWQSVQKLAPNDAGAHDCFGQSVFLDGARLAVGAPHDNLCGSGTTGFQGGPGAAYVFEHDGNGTWTEQARFQAADPGVNDLFGLSVSTSGGRVAVGAGGVDIGTPNTGAVYLFANDGNSWFQEARLIASDRARGDQLGRSVGIDGNTVLAGANRDNLAAVIDPGAAYLFVLENGVWSEQAKLTASDAARDDILGTAVALSGAHALAGAPQEDGAGSNSGALYAFDVSAFIVRDGDGDGVSDAGDNCPDTFNPDQTDSDGDGFGDACESCPLDADNDADDDGVCADVDNCPLTANPDQTDSDGDGFGDACENCPFDADNDADNDGVCADVDNCPLTANSDQSDTDGDGIGNLCDACALDAGNDADNDGVCADVDNCSLTANPDQADTDGDGIGDACDGCPLDAANDADNDGVCADVDNCALVTNSDQADTDGDGTGDVCDACALDADNDADNDGVCADADNCPFTANPDQADGDGDGVGDVCDGCPEHEVDATVRIEAHRHTVGSGDQPNASREPLADLMVSVYEKDSGSCARAACGGTSWKQYACIFNSCAPVAFGITDPDGVSTLMPAPGNYLVIGGDGSDKHLGVSVGLLACGDVVEKHLKELVTSDGKRKPAKTSRRTGSELLIVEPEFIEWSQPTEFYPLVFEADGDWQVDTTLTSPSGLPVGWERRSVSVADASAAIQYTVTATSGEWLPSTIRQRIDHAGRAEMRFSEVGVRVEPDFAALVGAAPGGTAVPTPSARIVGWMEPVEGDPSWQIRFRVDAPGSIDLWIGDAMNASAIDLPVIGVPEDAYGLIVPADRLVSGWFEPGEWVVAWPTARNAAATMPWVVLDVANAANGLPVSLQERRPLLMDP